MKKLRTFRLYEKSDILIKASEYKQGGAQLLEILTTDTLGRNRRGDGINWGLAVCTQGNFL